jgi:GT2 family glycosyltransferase
MWSTTCANNPPVQWSRRARDDCEYVLLLNPDTIVPPEAAHRLLDYLTAHPFVAVCAPQLTDRAGAAMPPLRKFLSSLREAPYLGLHLLQHIFICRGLEAVRIV